MRQLSCHWLLCLMMALVLAIAAPVVAGGHHGDATCVESLVGQDSAVAWELSAMVEPSEPDASLASPCCMPCAQCGATLARLTIDAVAASIPLSGPGLGTPSGPPAPFERPPRV